ncbi:MAG: glycosyltransferase [Rhodobacterales bacterium]|nr:MAG: glycosyltransferase [Rhodobacterales bacterium]
MSHDERSPVWTGRASDLPDRNRVNLGPAGPIKLGGPEPTGGFRLVVAIPSTGRATILPDTVRAIALQERLPDLLILSLAFPEDIGDLDITALPFPVRVVMGRKGATAQRNRVFEECTPDDIVLMLDDDFLMAPDYLQKTVEVFQDDPKVVLATGTVLADGIRGPGYNHDEGRKLLAERNSARLSTDIRPAYSGYGCNFAFRVSVVAAYELWFDEDLPLYSWLEDVDFSRRIARYGKLVKSGAMRGVHLGTKTGRTPGVRLGYSQIANPVYLLRKGSMTLTHVLEMTSRNTLSNLAHSFVPKPYTDFRGRLKGNLIAMVDLIRGRISPQRILDL